MIKFLDEKGDDINFEILTIDLIESIYQIDKECFEVYDLNWDRKSIQDTVLDKNCCTYLQLIGEEIVGVFQIKIIPVEKDLDGN